MRKTNEQIPIMQYVQELEGKVREAREEAKRYRRMVLIGMIRSIKFLVGVIVGGLIVVTGEFIIWGIWTIVRMKWR
jgi:hypothetical protein